MQRVFYGRSRCDYLQFYGRPVILTLVVGSGGAADSGSQAANSPDRLEETDFPESDRTQSEEVPMADPPDDFRRRDWDSWRLTASPISAEGQR
jgi:hypothetical protein